MPRLEKNVAEGNYIPQGVAKPNYFNKARCLLSELAQNFWLKHPTSSRSQKNLAILDKITRRSLKSQQQHDHQDGHLESIIQSITSTRISNNANMLRANLNKQTYHSHQEAVKAQKESANSTATITR